MTQDEHKWLQELRVTNYGRMLFITGKPRPDPVKAPFETVGWDEAAAAAKINAG